MNKPYISYVDPATMKDAAMLAELDRCKSYGTPRPESQAIRAHVPAVFWSFANSWRDVFHTGVADHGIKELCRLYEAIGDSPHWLVATPDGRFDGDPAAWKEISYREQATGTLRQDDDFRRKFHHPGLLAKILHGKD